MNAESRKFLAMIITQMDEGNDALNDMILEEKTKLEKMPKAFLSKQGEKMVSEIEALERAYQAGQSWTANAKSVMEGTMPTVKDWQSKVSKGEHPSVETQIETAKAQVFGEAKAKKEAEKAEAVKEDVKATKVVPLRKKVQKK